VTVLVTGGAGYIGAHVVRSLRAGGRDVVVVDDLSSGRVERLGPVPLVRLDLAPASCVGPLADVMRAHRVTSVIHLAARKRVAESVDRPLWYYQENLSGLAHVLGAMALASVGSIVYSSSAAVYGSVTESLVPEDARLEPINPYGRTKLAGEWLVRSAARAHGIDAVSLRYFNVAGAASPELGDTVVANLVTIVLDRLGRGLRPQVYGSQHPTPDGSCIRDYVHVVDLAEAHVATLDRLRDGGLRWDTFNVGCGRGASVLEVLALLSEITGLDTTPELGEARAGDAASVVAAVDRIADDVGWRARADLGEILRSAWSAWQSGPVAR